MSYVVLTSREVKELLEAAVQREGAKLGRKNNHGGASAFARKAGVSKTAVSFARRTGRPSTSIARVLGLRVEFTNNRLTVFEDGKWQETVTRHVNYFRRTQ